VILCSKHILQQKQKKNHRCPDLIIELNLNNCNLNKQQLMNIFVKMKIKYYNLYNENCITTTIDILNEIYNLKINNNNYNTSQSILYMVLIEMNGNIKSVKQYKLVFFDKVIAFIRNLF
jgi:hypothetical protein